MECETQQSSTMEDNDHHSTSSLMTSEEELQDSQTTQKSSVSQDQQEIQSQEGLSKDCNELLKSGDLETMVQNYKQIGGELMYNLKVLENKRQSLNKTLTDISHECEILFQQKEFQMKALVDLQIKLEDLDMERVKILKENQEDKTFKTEVFTHQLQSLLENDHYLRTTYDKFLEVLTTEKQNFENLVCHSRNEKERNKKSGEAYLKEMESIMTNFRREYSELLEREMKLFDQLDEAMVNCKNDVATEVRLHQEKDMYEVELRNQNDKNTSLNSLFSQKSKSLSEAQEKLSTKNMLFREKQNKINQNIAGLKHECDIISEDSIRKNKDLSENNETLLILKRDTEELKNNLLKAESQTVLKEEELNKLIEEFDLLSIELNTKKSQQVSLEIQAAELPIVQDALNKLSAEEQDLQLSLEKLLEEELSRSKELETVKVREQYTKEKMLNAQQELEEWEAKVKEAEKEELDLVELSKKLSIDSDNLLSEKKNELTELTGEIENNKSEENKLEEEINQITNEIDDLETNIHELTEEDSLLDKDNCDLQTQEEEIEIFKDKVVELNNKIIAIDTELEYLNTSLSGAKEIDELEAEIKKIELETKEATLHFKGQYEAIESSFGSQAKNLEDKYAREIKDLERMTVKGEARTKRMTDALPQLNKDIAILEADLKNLLPNLVGEVGKILQTLDQVADYYKKLVADGKKKGSKVSDVRNLTAIEEHFAKPMKCMISLEGMPKVDLEIPTPEKYKLIISAFREKYNLVLKQNDGSLFEAVEKIQELGSCVLGKKWVKPVYPQTLNDAEISSSTVEIMY